MMLSRTVLCKELYQSLHCLQLVLLLLYLQRKHLRITLTLLGLGLLQFRENSVLQDFLVLNKNILFFDVGSDEFVSELSYQFLPLEQSSLQLHYVSLLLQKLLLQDVV
jgi:hypothetical protein